MINLDKILVLAPHTDDGELGCGATISRLLEEGKTVYYVAFSTCDKSVPPGFPKDALKTELKNASAVLGIDPQNLFMFDYEVRQLAASRHEILEKLVDLKKQIAPDIVFLPSVHDLHQDHNVIATEGLRAFKKGSILGYEQPWNHISFNSTAFISCQEKHLAKKMQALQCYKTQENRNYMSKDFIYGLAKTRGTQVNTDFAEAFEILRWVVS